MQQKVLFARQPIFDKQQRVFAYELLFRNGDVDKAEFIDGDLATKSVLLNAYAENSAPQLLNGLPGFLNVSRTMMSAIPDFATQFLVVEILEDEHLHPALPSEMRNLKKRGFNIALDDFVIVDHQEEIVEAADIVKLDVLTYSEAELTDAVKRLRESDVKLLAEKVENHQMFKLCQSLGFDYFQGYFFCRPEIVKGHILDANRRAIFELVREVYQPEVNIQSLTDIVKQDALLSFKLLKLVNSSFYKRAHQVDSISHAVMMLGITRIRSWATLVSLGKLNQKPDELQKESLARAYMCECLGENISPEYAAMAFSAGLLSCLDAWFDYPMQDLMSVLPLSGELHDALVKKSGRTGDLLSIVVNYMHSNWTDIPAEALSDIGITLDDCGAAYDFAIDRADRISALMTEE